MSEEKRGYISYLTQTNCILCGTSIDSRMIVTAEDEPQLDWIHDLINFHIKVACDTCYPKVKTSIDDMTVGKSQSMFVDTPDQPLILWPEDYENILELLRIAKEGFSQAKAHYQLRAKWFEIFNTKAFQDALNKIRARLEQEAKKK